jgi:hypothetical protein
VDHTTCTIPLSIEPVPDVARLVSAGVKVAKPRRLRVSVPGPVLPKGRKIDAPDRIDSDRLGAIFTPAGRL